MARQIPLRKTRASSCVAGATRERDDRSVDIFLVLFVGTNLFLHLHVPTTRLGNAVATQCNKLVRKRALRPPRHSDVPTRRDSCGKHRRRVLCTHAQMCRDRGFHATVHVLWTSPISSLGHGRTTRRHQGGHRTCTFPNVRHVTHVTFFTHPSLQP